MRINKIKENDIEDIFTGDEHSFLLKKENNKKIVKAWGLNSKGQLGIGKSSLDGEQYINIYIPTKIILDQNITIKPDYNKYKTKYRNLENIPTSIKVTTSESTILSVPFEKTPYIFLQIQVCDTSKIVDINFFNAYNNSQLNYRDSIDSDIKINYLLIENIKMDTELKMSISGSTKVFIRHIGISDEYYPYVDDMKLTFTKENNTLKFNQPISNEEFSYIIYYDEKNKIKEKNYDLCSYAENTKLSEYSQSIESSAEEIEITINFGDKFEKVEEFDILVLAKQINNGKLIITSDVLQITANTEKDSQSKKNDEKNYATDNDVKREPIETRRETISSFAMIAIITETFVNTRNTATMTVAITRTFILAMVLANLNSDIYHILKVLTGELNKKFRINTSNSGNGDIKYSVVCSRFSTRD